MKLFPAEHEPWGVFSRAATYVGAVVVLFCLFTAVAANIISPGDKLPAGPAQETTGVAKRAIAEDEFSAANRQPVWIVPTTKYDYTPPANARAAKGKSNTVNVRKYEPRPKSRMARQPLTDEASSAYGYAGAPRANRYQQFDNIPTGSLNNRISTGSLTSRQAIY